MTFAFLWAHLYARERYSRRAPSLLALYISLSSGVRGEIEPSLCGGDFDLTQERLDELRKTHGKSLEFWWKTHFGYPFDYFTQSEARYPARFPDAEHIRNQIAAVRAASADASLTSIMMRVPAMCYATHSVMWIGPSPEDPHHPDTLAERGEPPSFTSIQQQSPRIPRYYVAAFDAR